MSNVNGDPYGRTFTPNPPHRPLVWVIGHPAGEIQITAKKARLHCANGKGQMVNGKMRWIKNARFGGKMATLKEDFIQVAHEGPDTVAELGIGVSEGFWYAKWEMGIPKP